MNSTEADETDPTGASAAAGMGTTEFHRSWNRRLSLALALVMAALCVYAMRRADADLWGYLAYGRLFVQQGGPVEWDPFSYTCAGCTWIYFEHLSHVSLWLAYNSGGALGLIVWKCVLGGAAVGFVLKTIRALEPRPEIWLPVYLLMLGVAPRYFLFRPQLYTFALFSLFVEVSIGYLAGRRRRLWPLVPLTALWANLHGGFLAGLGVLGLALVLSVAQQLNQGTRLTSALRAASGLWMTLLGAIVASFVNPQGWRLWRYLLTELSHDTNRRYIGEWMPLSFARDPWSASSALLLLVAVATTGAVAWRRGRLLLGLRPWQWLAASTPLAVMSVLSVRHMPILMIWVSPVLVLLAGAMPMTQRSRSRRFWTALSWALAVPAMLVLSIVIAIPTPAIDIPEGTLGEREPFGAVEFMKRGGLAGNVYLPLWWGSYTTWELYPRIRVAIDGRNVSLYPTEVVRSNLEFYVRDDGDLSEPLRFASDYLLVPSDVPVLAQLRMDSRWQRLFEDPDCVLFVRADGVSELFPRGLDKNPVFRATRWRPRLLR